MNVNSPAKSISDTHLSYARLLSIKADFEELQRVGKVTVPDAQIAAVDAQILEVRAQIPLMD